MPEYAPVVFSTLGYKTFSIYKLIKKLINIICHGVLLDLLTKDPTPELISLAARESFTTRKKRKKKKKKRKKKRRRGRRKGRRERERERS